MLTHFDEGGQAWMVDVGAKDETVAPGRGVRQHPDAAADAALVRSGTAKKGDVLGVARIAAIQAAKRTWELIPLCPPDRALGTGGPVRRGRGRLPRVVPRRGRMRGRTGVRDGGAHAVSAGLLTIYDMCKAVDRGMTMATSACWRRKAGSRGATSRRSVAGYSGHRVRATPAIAQPADHGDDPRRYFTSATRGEPAMATAGHATGPGKGTAALAPGQNTCQAKNSARLAITPTTAR